MARFFASDRRFKLIGDPKPLAIGFSSSSLSFFRILFVVFFCFAGRKKDKIESG